MTQTAPQNLPVNGVELAWWELGPSPQGTPTLVLVHGFTGSAHDFALVADDLASDRRVVMLDQRGHGRSTKTERVESYTIDQLVADLTVFLEAVGGGPVDLLGHSMGGRVAMGLVLSRPDLVRSLVLMDTSAWSFMPPDKGIRELVRAWIEAFEPAQGMPESLGLGGPEDALIEEQMPRSWQEEKAELFAGMDPYAVKAFGMALMADIADGRVSLKPELPSITCSTTVIAGEHDHPLIDQAPELAGLVADGRLAAIEGAYHSPQLTHAEQWKSAIRAHLAWADAAAGHPMTGAAPPQASDRITLAGSDVAIPPLGVGTWAWGDKGVWGMGGYDQSLTESTIREAWEASIEAGIVLFDTAEIYGGGESERIIGRMLAADPGVRGRVVLATKFMPSPWKLNVRGALLSAARHSLERLRCDAIDLYQIHGPVSLRSHDALADALAAAHAEGLVKAVGVSNYSAKETRSIDTALRKRGLRLASNQIEFSLLRTMPREVGLLDCCRELGVVPLAYSPIGQGRLTGKYSASNPPPGGRTFSAHPMEQVDATVAELRGIGEDHDGRTPSQVALAWLVAQGAVPIPGAKNRSQAEQNAGAVGWQMTDEELARLDASALYGMRGIRERVWQHG